MMLFFLLLITPVIFISQCEGINTVSKPNPNLKICLLNTFIVSFGPKVVQFKYTEYKNT